MLIMMFLSSEPRLWSFVFNFIYIRMIKSWYVFILFKYQRKKKKTKKIAQEGHGPYDPLP